MSTYRERRSARADRLRAWADSRDRKSTAALEQAQSIIDGIPLGQPILVGHHSERRARRDVDRIDSGLRRGFEHAATAAAHRSKAVNIEAACDRAIYSDDADAIEQLTARLVELEAERDRVKAYNATCRQIKGDVGDLSLLTEAERAALLSCIRFAGWQCKHGAFPSYKLSNLSANISRNRKRLDALRAEA